jgi:hypothetical protein
MSDAALPIMESTNQTPPDKKPLPKVAITMSALFLVAVLIATAFAVAGYPRDESRQQPSTMEQPSESP